MNWRDLPKGSEVIDFIPDEQVTLHEGVFRRKVGQYHNNNLDPSRITQVKKTPQLFDNNGKIVGSNPSNYFYTRRFNIPLTYYHKKGGKLISRKNFK